MEFLLSHWHCILPAAAILIGLFFMNRDKGEKKEPDRTETTKRSINISNSSDQ